MLQIEWIKQISNVGPNNHNARRLAGMAYRRFQRTKAFDKTAMTMLTMCLISKFFSIFLPCFNQPPPVRMVTQALPRAI